jgi:MscS family membrane protein
MNFAAIVSAIISQFPLGGTPSAPPAEPATAPSTQPTTQPEPDFFESAASLFGVTFEETTLFGWIVLLAGIFVGMAAGKIIQTLLKTISARLQSRGWNVRAALFRFMAGPANLALMSMGLKIGLTFIVMIDNVKTFFNRLISFLFIVSIAWFLYNLVELLDFALRRLAAKSNTKLDDAVVILLRRALRIFLLIMMVLFVAENIFNANVTAWLAGLGIAGLAVSLAAQDSIKNLFGSVTILMEHPFGVGDRIVFDGIDGFVEDIGFRSTKIRNFNGHLLTVPNMKFTDGVVENISARPWARRSMNITVTYDTSPEKLEEATSIIKSILTEPDIAKDMIVPDRPPRVFFNEFNADSLNIAVTYFYPLNVDGRDWWTFQALAATVNHRILVAFNAAGIQFAFPTRTVFLAGDPDRELMVRVKPPDDPSG